MKRLLLAAAFAALPVLAHAGDISPDDLSKMRGYTLSMDKIRAMQAAMDDVRRAENSDPSLAARSSDVGDSSKSLAEMEARLKSIPQLYAIYTRHGLNADDAVLMPLVLMSAGVAAEYPQSAAKLADQTSPAQITFFKAHKAELKKMPWLYGGGQ